MVLGSFFGFLGCNSSNDPAKWSGEKLDKWFAKGEWLNGLNVTPDASINRREFAVSYFRNKDRWDKAFMFLKSTDLKSLELKRHDIDGDNLFAPVSEYTTKLEEVARFEAHRKYIDIQYVISGSEKMSVAPFSELQEVTEPYDAAKDIEFMTVKNSRHMTATPENLFIFFPSDIHRPSVMTGDTAKVRKIVVKVKVD